MDRGSGRVENWARKGDRGENMGQGCEGKSARDKQACQASGQGYRPAVPMTPFDRSPYHWSKESSGDDRGND